MTKKKTAGARIDNNQFYSKGGARPGAGRKKGAATHKTREYADKAAAEGVLPLQVMVESMRRAWERAVAETDLEKKKELYREAASFAHDAAPYMHPKMQPVDGRGSTDLNINIIIQKLGDGRDE